MKKIAISLMALVLFSCGEEKKNIGSEENPGTTIDIENELQAIENLRTNFSLVLKEGRYQDMGKYVTADVKIIRPGGLAWDGMYSLGQERGRFPYDSIIMTPTETYILNDTIAYDWGSSKVYYTNRAGQQVELRNSYLVILKKENGEWKLHREVGSSVVE